MQASIPAASPVSVCPKVSCISLAIRFLSLISASLALSIKDLSNSILAFCKSKFAISSCLLSSIFFSIISSLFTIILIQQSIKLTTVIKLSALYIKNITVCKLVLQTLIYAEISYIFINSLTKSCVVNK